MRRLRLIDPLGLCKGTGVQIRMTEPWSGYTHMKAAEVIDRLVAEPGGVLSLVLLYERSNRARRTVLAAAERELARRSSRSLNASAAGSSA